MINALNTAIYSRLSSDGTLTTLLGGTAIYFEHAPENHALPFVVWSWPSIVDLNINPDKIVDAVLYVRGYADNRLTAGSIEAALSDRLHKHNLSITGWNTISLWQEDTVTLAAPGAAPDYYTAGGNFRLTTEKE